MPPTPRRRTLAASLRPALLVAALAGAAPAGAQGAGVSAGGAAGGGSATEAQLCARAGDARFPDARVRLQAVSGAGGAAGAFAQGCLHMAEGRLELAAEAFERATQQGAGSAVYHFWLGRAYGAQAQRANVLKQASLARRTKREFDRAVQLDPEYLDAREGLMQYYLLAPGIMGGSRDRAREQLAEIRRRSPYRGAMLAVDVATRDRDWATATRELQALVQQHPDSARPWSALAAIQGQQGRWDEAWATIDRMQQAMPDAPAAQYAVGRLAAESGQQLERGAAALQRYLKTTPRPGDPPLAAAHARLGAVLEKQGRREEARAAYEAALRLDPRLRAAREGLARVR